VNGNRYPAGLLTLPLATDSSLAAKIAAELRSAWTDECVRPYTSKNKSRQLSLTAEC